MADIIENQEQAQTPEQQNLDAKAALDQQMHIALNNGRVPATSVENIQGNEQQIVGDQNTGNEQHQQLPEVPIFSFDTFKEKFQYEKPEDVLADIESLRAYKANPVAAEIKFENEESKKLFDAIKGGKQKEAYAILAEQDRLESLTSIEVTKDNAPDIIKLGMQLKYKDLTPAEIDYKYKKQFTAPKEPVQAVDELDEDFATRKAEWKDVVTDIEMDKILEAKTIRPELEAHKHKLVLPEIAADVDKDYLQWKQSRDAEQKLNDSVQEAYKAFKDPKVLEKKVAFNDEANKVSFNYEYQATPEDLAEAVEMATDIDKFFNRFIKQDGSPDREGFLRAIHFAIHPDKVINSALNQSKNGTIKAISLPNNSGNNTGRQLPQGFEVSELDANMQRSLGGYMNGNGVRR